MPVCFICGRRVPRLNYHHIVPRKISNDVGRSILPRSGPTTVGLCEFCLGWVHKIFGNKALARMSAEEMKNSQEIYHYRRCVLPNLIRRSIARGSPP